MKGKYTVQPDPSPPPRKGVAEMQKGVDRCVAAVGCGGAGGCVWWRQAGWLSTRRSAHRSPAHSVYYVAADEVDWSYTPDGGDRCAGGNASFTLEEAAAHSGTFRKALYREYTDDTFATLKQPRCIACGACGGGGS